MSQNSSNSSQKRLPAWFKVSRGKLAATRELSKRLNANVPNTICQEARCPNRSECFSKGLLTFMILGTVCTRNCKFCSVAHGKPLDPDKSEIVNILDTIDKLSLKFVVLTSPNRDDLPDGGSSHYAYIVSKIKENYPKVKVEVLVPDFQGNRNAIDCVIASSPDVINHNMETVPSLYTVARKGSLYKRSLDLLAYVKQASPDILTKSGVMVGLGETKEELIQTFLDISRSSVDILTVGQYLRPSSDSLEVSCYYDLEEFDYLKKEAQKLGFRFVFSGPMVRSSYLAEHVFDDVLESSRG